MKRTQVTDLFANIKSTIVSFISILMFAALGVGVFLGISWASPALENAAQTMFDEGSFHNFQIQYPYGLTDADLKELSQVEGVTEIEAERQSFQTIREGARKYTVKVQSLGQSIDVPIVVEGALPTKSDEIALHAESAKQLGIGVGDTVTFEKDAVETDDAAADDTETANNSGMTYLLTDSFKVTALVNSADYVAHSSATYGFSTAPSGGVDALAWVADDAFDASAFQNGYPIVNVRCDGLDGKLTFSDDYKQASAALQEPIEALGAALAITRFDDLYGQMQKQIDDGQAELDKAEADIDQAEKDIAEGEVKLNDARAELEQGRIDGQAELDAAYTKLINGEAEKAEGERKLNEASAKVYDAESRINEADADIDTVAAEANSMEAYKKDLDKKLEAGEITEAQYNKLLSERCDQENATIAPISQKYELDLPTITPDTYDLAIEAARLGSEYRDEIPITVDGEDMTLGEARQRLASAKAELASAQATYDESVATLNNGWAEYYEGVATYESKIAEAEQEIADGEAEIEDAKNKVIDAKDQVAANKPLLEEAREVLAAMAQYVWTVLPRAYNSGVTEVSTFCGVTANLSISMAAPFIIVGLLVSYFAVSRIVHEQIVRIGTKKALGFRQGEITSSFLWYSGIAVAAGAIVGAILAYLLVEGIIGSVLGGMFAFGAYPAYFGWDLFLIITIIELGLVLIATYLACRKILKQHAVELLRGEKPPTGKTRFYEKWGIWQKIPLFIQVIINNCVNDGRRVVSTIVGVAGCTALIVTAITLNNDVMKSYDIHYEDVYGFNAIVYADFDTEGAADNLESALKEQGFATAQTFSKSYLMVQPNGESGAMHVVVPVDEEAFAQLYHVNPHDGIEFDLSGEGAWVSQAYADHLGAKVGDTITIDGGDGVKHEVPILGFNEFWLSYNEMVVGRAYFEKEFGSVTPNVVICQTGDVPVSDVEQKLASVAGFDSIVDDAALQYSNFETFSSVSSAVVIIYLVLSALMAIVVLLNLNVMFINEKKRELIVLMINGFSVKDARHYISYDNIVLTALGIIVGLLLGWLMGDITVASIEPVTGVFIKDCDGWAILIGILGSTLLAIIMGLIALRRINKFELTDITRF